MSRINIQRALAVLAFATISALQLANASDYADITCRQSGMCSMGGTKHFHGEIASSKGFKEALDSVSFKREIIIVVTFGTMYLEFVFQLRAQLRRLGMDHFLVLSYNETGCQQVKDVARGQKQVSCAWDDSPQLGDAWKGGTLLWHLRWRFLARAARIQYNVLSLDSDYLILQDPYIFLKRPPFSEAQILNAPTSDCGMGGGFMYTQNTRPDGPAAWLFHHTTEVPLRWMDNNHHDWGMSGGGLCWTSDESFLDDALWSILAGRPINPTLFKNCAKEDWTATGPDGKTYSRHEVLERMMEAVSCMSHVNKMVASPPTTFRSKPEFTKNYSDYTRIEMKMPIVRHTGNTPELDPPIFTGDGGLYSDAYFKQLKDDCDDESKCPWFKDGTGNFTETFMHVPKWMSHSASGLNHGFLTPLDGSRPRQVMVHYHYMHSRDPWKLAASKIYGGFDWVLSKALHADQSSNEKMPPGPYMNGAAPDRVIALSPLIDLASTRSLREFKMITAGLLQLALISNRTVVYPDMPCAAKWLHREKDGNSACVTGDQLLDLDDDSYMPYAARVKPSDKDNLQRTYQVFSAFVADEGCHEPRSFVSGMLNVEFEHWLKADCPSHNAKGPWGGNTMFHIDRRDEAVFNAQAYVTEYMVEIDEEQAHDHLKKFEKENLMYLGHPVIVKMKDADVAGMDLDGDDNSAKSDLSGGTYGGWKTKYAKVLTQCRGLHYTPYMSGDSGAAKPSDFQKGFANASIGGDGMLYVGQESLLKIMKKTAQRLTKVDRPVLEYEIPDTGGLAPVAGGSCEGSGMCSLGKTAHFYGSVRTGAGLRDALEKTSYKKEIILVSTIQAVYLEMVFQLENQFRKLGMGHFFVLSIIEKSCVELQDVANATVGYSINCGWDDSPVMPRAWGRYNNHLWHIRWRFMARAARLSYNILALDSDYMILQDPYAYLKRPPFSDFSLLGVEEHMCGMNGGFVYIQNTKPDGPVSWLFHRMTEVPLRWQDDNMDFLRSLGKQKTFDAMCMTFDQSFLDDALHSTMVGMPISQMMILMCTLPTWTANGSDGATQKQAVDRQMSMFKCYSALTPKELPAPPGAWPAGSPVLPKQHRLLKMARLRVPNGNGTIDLPPQLGGPVFTRHGGNYTQDYFQQLNEDCPDCPWWKDTKPEDEGAAASNTELFAIVPRWMSTSASWLNHGWLDPPDGSTPRQVMLHYHVLGFEAKEWKAAVSKVYGAFDWELSKKLHSVEVKSAKLTKGPYFMGRAPSKVLVLRPEVDLSRTRNIAEFKRITASLIQMAVISERTLVFPDIPCKAKWTHVNKEHGHLVCGDPTKHLQLDREALPYMALVEPWNRENSEKEVALFYSFYAAQSCLSIGGHTGLMNVEYQHWMIHDAQDSARKGPSDQNCIFCESPQGEGYLFDDISFRDVQEVSAELAKYKDEAVLYVGKPVVVDFSTDQKTQSSSLFKRVMNGCPGVSYVWDGLIHKKDNDIAQDFKTWWSKKPLILNAARG